jgi:hypothetical protein
MIRRRSEDDPMEGEAGTALTLVNLVAGRFAGQLARQQQQPAVKAALQLSYSAASASASAACCCSLPAVYCPQTRVFYTLASDLLTDL